MSGMEFVQAIARNDQVQVSALLAGAPELALARLEVGATRQTAEEYFLDEIDHYVYAGDTALHIAAAAYQASFACELIDARGGDLGSESPRRPAASLRGRWHAGVRALGSRRATGHGDSASSSAAQTRTPGT